MAIRATAFLVLFCCTALLTAAQDSVKKDPYKDVKKDVRLETIRHAQVWRPTDIPSMDLKAGPQDVAPFPPEAVVTCDYVDKEVTGTPKFWCAVAPGDEVKVKFGEANGEVYGEVAATRLLWALGFGVDRIYPVMVVCRGCPAEPMKPKTERVAETTFDPAIIERLMAGDEMESGNIVGWEWVELTFVDTSVGGAPLAHRDALKLLAAFIQHTDSKPQQQRLVCLDRVMNLSPLAEGKCAHPFMMLNDLGRTFGKANMFNKDMPSSVDLKSWLKEPVWKDDKGCTANIAKSLTGTLEHPKIGEAGRQFLSGLLAQLSDQQLRDLFEVSRVTKRDATTTVDDWVMAFKKKRDEVASRACAS
jgi:hypothetical protein